MDFDILHIANKAASLSLSETHLNNEANLTVAQQEIESAGTGRVVSVKCNLMKDSDINFLLERVKVLY